MRLMVLRMLCFLPDVPMLKLQYRIKFDRPLNLKKPERFTEKIQWYKIHYRNPVMHQCVNKYEVREYVRAKGLESILIPLYAHYDSIEQVEWEKLPEQFVIKTQTGGGGLDVVVCPDKSKLNITEVQKKLQCEKQKSNYGGREWAYYGLEPGIVVEELLVNREKPESGVEDYKIYCFSGKPKYIHVDMDRYTQHKRNFYDTKWNRLELESEYPNYQGEIQKPQGLEEMLKVAEILSSDFPFVRVDLYNIDGKIYFGELTFYPSSGYAPHQPDEWDYKFGEDFELKEYK